MPLPDRPEDDAPDERDRREQLVALLDHDLRGPLAAVAAQAALLPLKAHDAATVQSIAALIQGHAKRMAVLLDDVLELARGGPDGGIAVRLAPVDDIGQALAAVVSEQQDEYPKHTIAGLIDSCPRIVCDRARVLQLASHLLANALDHGSPEGTVRFNARADGSHLVLRVSNDGEPIPQDALDRGLGLHLCAQIVAAHHGRLDVTSTREAGTTVTARLPLSPASS